MTVLVTGAGGFIAKHVIHELLSENYKVLGTVKCEHEGILILKQFNNANLSFEVVPEIADSGVVNGLFEKHKGEINYVIHMASPLIHYSYDYEMTMMRPIIEGTKNVLNGCFQYNVKRVVITSSALAIVNFGRVSNEGEVFTESDWNPVTRNNYGNIPLIAYAAAKKFGELEAWNFIKNNEVQFALSTVCPTYVFGPRLFDEDLKDISNLANKSIEDLIHSIPGQSLGPELNSEFVDVRDVARAHVLAFQKDSTKGKRLAVSAAKFSLQGIVDILNHTFPQLKGRITQGPKPGSIEECSERCLNTKKTDKLLEITYKTLEETVYDLTQQVLKVEGIL